MEGLATLKETAARVEKQEVLDAAIATVDRRIDAEEIREKFGDLADLAWLSTISVMREKSYTDSFGKLVPGSEQVDARFNARFNHHLELLNIYMRSAGEDINSLNADELLSKFGVLLETRKNTLPESLQSFVRFYEILHTQLRTYQSSFLIFAMFLNLADICFRIMSILETTVYPAPGPL
jgi:hypothetical protein